MHSMAATEHGPTLVGVLVQVGRIAAANCNMGLYSSRRLHDHDASRARAIVSFSAQQHAFYGSALRHHSASRLASGSLSERAGVYFFL